MRIKVELTGERNIILPTGYNSAIQGLIYSFFDKDSATWLHEHGFKYENRSFKMFTFSPFLEKARYDKLKRLFTFPLHISFMFSSPVQWICEQFATNFIKQNNVFLNNQKLYINSVNILKSPDINGSKIKIRTISPIEVHSTLFKADNSKKTYYYSPTEPEFNELINKNLKKKYQALFNKECPCDLKIYPVRIENNKEKKRRFKEIIIKGWTGPFFLESDPYYLKFALDTGIGSRNSQGFGMFEVVKNYEN